MEYIQIAAKMYSFAEGIEARRPHKISILVGRLHWCVEVIVMEVGNGARFIVLVVVARLKVPRDVR